MKKWFVVLMYVLCILLIFLIKDQLQAWIEQDTSDFAPLLLIATLLALVPAIPYGVIAGVIGAKYGLMAGGMINVVASTTAAMIMFWIVRYSVSLPAQKYISRYHKINRFTQMYEANPFLAVLFARLVPVIPAQAVNIYSGISRIPALMFFTATVVGKVPVMLAFALMGDQLLINPSNIVIIIAVYSVFLVMVYAIYRLWTKVIHK